MVGCENLDMDYEAKHMDANGHMVRQGDWLTLDGSDGTVYAGEIPLILPQLPPAFTTLLKWADERRRLGVRANADTPHDARKAREMGAEGIGLSPTDHTFVKDLHQPERSHDPQLAIPEMTIPYTPTT